MDNKKRSQMCPKCNSHNIGISTGNNWCWWCQDCKAHSENLTDEEAETHSLMLKAMSCFGSKKDDLEEKK